MRIVCIANTAGRHAGIEVPPGDLLICVGSITACGFSAEIRDFAAWATALPHTYKIVVAGDRDHAAVSGDTRDMLGSLTYLENEGAHVDGLNIWGIPYHQGWDSACEGAFAREAEMAQMYWDQVPAGLDVLVSQRPPSGILDDSSDPVRAGCPTTVAALGRIRPRLHIFGGDAPASARFIDGHTFVNATSRPGLGTRVLNLYPKDG